MSFLLQKLCRYTAGELPSLSFLEDLQTTMAGRSPPPIQNNSTPAPTFLPEELLLARFILVRRDGAQPPLGPVYNGPCRVLERLTHFFLLQTGERTDKVSTLRLKPACTPGGTESAQSPPVRAPPPQWHRRRL